MQYVRGAKYVNRVGGCLKTTPDYLHCKKTDFRLVKRSVSFYFVTSAQ